MEKQLLPGDLVRILSKGRAIAKVDDVFMDGGKCVHVRPFIGNGNGDGEFGEVVSYSADQLEYYPPYHISMWNMQRFAKYEITYQELTGNTIPKKYFTYDKRYRMTTRDILDAVNHITETKPTCKQVKNEWFIGVSDYLFEGLRVDRAQGIVNDVLRANQFFPEKDTELFYHIYRLFKEAPAEDWEKDELFEDVFPLDKMHHIIDWYYANKDLPLLERSYSDELKRNFVRHQYNLNRFKSLSNRFILLFRKFVDEYVEQGDLEMMRVKAFCVAGGNPAYTCDWELAEEYLLTLYDADSDKYAANSLGCIYYDGYVNDDVPQFAKAMEYFKPAAEEGVYESIRKMAWMYAEGLGVEQDDEIAKKLITMIYEKNRDIFCNHHYECDFADSAYLMGKVYDDGIGIERNYRKAMDCYLEAECAMRLKTEFAPSSDDKFLTTRIYNALKKVKGRLEFKAESDHQFMYPMHLYKLLEGGFEATLTVDKIQDDSCRLTLERIMPEDGKKESVLFVMPYFGMARVMDRVRMYAEACSDFSTTKRTVIKIDNIRYNNKMYEFCYKDEVLFAFKARSFRVKSFNSDDPEEKEYKLVTVAGIENDLVKELICEVKGVEVGDNVIIGSGMAEEKVQVVAMVGILEDDLEKPLAEYPRVVRKVYTSLEYTNHNPVHDEWLKETI